MCCVIGYTGHDMSADKFKEYLMRTVSRGPDDQRVVEGPFGLMGFGRLAIMGLTPEGMQPFLPRGRLRGLQRRTLRLPLRERDFEAPGLQVHLRLRLRDFAAALL